HVAGLLRIPLSLRGHRLGLGGRLRAGHRLGLGGRRGRRFLGPRWLRRGGLLGLVVAGRLVPELVGDQQQLPDSGEDPAQCLGGSFLYAFTDLRHAHVTLSSRTGTLSAPRQAPQRPWRTYSSL